MEFGECVEGNRLIDEMELVSPLRPVVRKATEADRRTVEENREKEKRAFQICQQKIQDHGLEMKLVEVEYNFDGSKILFFFTSEGRVDFRALVRDLAGVFHTRIELRQIGVRDEAKMLGGLGVCGRPYCCNAFLNDFHPVSIKMAKTQNLSLNPTKISGACGRLMCCLKYEQEAYEDVLKRTPKLESLVETPDGVGTVNSVQLLREKVKVRLDDDPENPRVYSNADITVIRSGKGKRPEGYELPDPAERAQRQAAHLRDARVKTPAPAAPAAPRAGTQGRAGRFRGGKGRRRGEGEVCPPPPSLPPARLLRAETRRGGPGAPAAAKGGCSPGRGTGPAGPGRGDRQVQAPPPPLPPPQRRKQGGGRQRLQAPGVKHHFTVTSDRPPRHKRGGLFFWTILAGSGKRPVFGTAPPLY